MQAEQQSETHKGKGKGGRNTEFLLALAIALEGKPGINALAADVLTYAGVAGVGAVDACLFVVAATEQAEPAAAEGSSATLYVDASGSGSTCTSAAPGEVNGMLNSSRPWLPVVLGATVFGCEPSSALATRLTLSPCGE